MRTNRLLGAGLFSLGGLVIVYAVLGPLVLDVIHFRTTASGLNQIRGGDLAALVVVVPICMAVGWLAWRGHRAAPVLALAPTIFAMYMYSQLILGNEFLHLPGNVERFFGLLLAMFLLAEPLECGIEHLVFRNLGDGLLKLQHRVAVDLVDQVDHAEYVAALVFEGVGDIQSSP